MYSWPNCQDCNSYLNKQHLKDILLKNYFKDAVSLKLMEMPLNMIDKKPWLFLCPSNEKAAHKQVWDDLVSENRLQMTGTLPQ